MGFVARATKRRSVWLIFGAVLIVAGMATATTLLFNQSFPSVALAGLTKNCSMLTADNGVTALDTVDFDCTIAGSPSMAAFVVGIPGDYTPTFLLPLGSLNLYVIADTNTGPGTFCFSQIGAQLLGTGSAIHLFAGNYDYCLQLSATTPVSAFTVTWAQ